MSAVLDWPEPAPPTGRHLGVWCPAGRLPGSPEEDGPGQKDEDGEDVIADAHWMAHTKRHTAATAQMMSSTVSLIG